MITIKKESKFSATCLASPPEYKFNVVRLVDSIFCDYEYEVTSDCSVRKCC